MKEYNIAFFDTILSAFEILRKQKAMTVYKPISLEYFLAVHCIYLLH